MSSARSATAASSPSRAPKRFDRPRIVIPAILNSLAKISPQTKCKTFLGRCCHGTQVPALSLDDRCEIARLQAEGRRSGKLQEMMRTDVEAKHGCQMFRILSSSQSRSV